MTRTRMGYTSDELRQSFEPGRDGRLNQDCKRTLWSAMKARGGV
jgi:hypothetical protein